MKSMSYLLILHISLGALLVVTAITRAIAILAQKISPKTGRYFVVGLGSALIASGLALVITTHSSLTGICLASLVIVSAIIASELGLEYFAKKNPSTNI
jgi:hypothetical protein